MKWSLPLLGLLIVPLLFNSVPLEILRLKTFDTFVETPEPSGHFTILNITEEDVQERGGYPFPRQDLAEIQRQLINEGALGVGWVILFPQPDRFGGDADFAMSLQQGTNVLAIPEYENRIYPSTDGTVILGDNPVDMITLSGHLANVSLLELSAYQGIVSAPTDVDNLI